MLKLAIGFIVLAIITGTAQSQQARYGNESRVLLPDPSVTPGHVTIADTATVCTTKWGTDARHVTKKMKTDVYKAYGTAPGTGVCKFKTRTTKSGGSVSEGCEIDHLISRELGGADEEDNLWPQPYTQHPGAHEKDWLENELHKEVCRGKITLQDAQNEIKTDWYNAYLKRKNP